jgi:hypothetical protein
MEFKILSEVILDQLCHPLHWARLPYWNTVKIHRTEGKSHLGPENGTSLGNRVFAGGMKGPEMRSSWTSRVTHTIGPGRHIGIWSSP